MEISERYKFWLDCADEDTVKELNSIKDNQDEIYDRFYKELEFGTGGMRGVIGAGSNRINKYTIAKATQGFCEYIKNFGPDACKQGVAIAHDNRRCSRLFAEVTAGVLAANGIKAFLFEDLRTTPELSFAVRYLNCFGGVVVTASHNPPEYNGYKIYDNNGCQLIPEEANKVIDYISKINNEFDVKCLSMEKAGDLIEIIGEEIDAVYYEKVLSLQFDKGSKRNIKVIYTPQHGTGNIPVRKVLKSAGFDVIPVLSQCTADPEFSNTKNPNPETKEAYELAVEMLKDNNADIAIATDPDCDRLGAVINCGDGKLGYLTGNQSGALILYYLLSRMKEKGTIPSNAVMCNTFVTSNLGDIIAESFGVSVIKTYTGFKYIGDRIKHFEQSGEKTYVFGYEESYGCLIGDFVRDKDAVQASLMFCEAADYYKKQGKTLVDVIEEIYQKYGYFIDSQTSVVLKGAEGAIKIREILDNMRANPAKEVAGIRVSEFVDFLNNPPKDFAPENLLLYNLEDGSFIAVRPSGTEPKCKFYYCVRGNNKIEAEEKHKNIKQSFDI